MHTSLATAILDQIKLRKLDLFFELEEKILSKQTLDKSLMQVSLKMNILSGHPQMKSSQRGKEGITKNGIIGLIIQA